MCVCACACACVCVCVFVVLLFPESLIIFCCCCWTGWPTVDPACGLLHAWHPIPLCEAGPHRQGQAICAQPHGRQDDAVGL